MEAMPEIYLSCQNISLCGKVWHKLGSASKEWRVGRLPEPVGTIS